MSSNNSADNEDSFDDDIGTGNDFDELESSTGVVERFDARRRLEEVLEAKALERLIKGDFFDD